MGFLLGLMGLLINTKDSNLLGQRKANSKTELHSSSDPKRGRFLYMRDCAHCHGVTGDGKSSVRQTLHPVPLDLRGFDFSEAYILDLLHNGIPGSDMPAWHDSPEDDLHEVSAYTARLGLPDQLSEADQYAPADALHEAGRRIYRAHCIRCHGTSGGGDGKDARRYLPAPPSFERMRPSFALARTVIKNGVPGTAMASWPLLTDQEIQAVTYYIRSFYRKGPIEAQIKTGAAQ